MTRKHRIGKFLEAQVLVNLTHLECNPPLGHHLDRTRLHLGKHLSRTHLHLETKLIKILHEN